jgi:hypothetical protein
VLLGANLTIARIPATPTATSPNQTTAVPLLCVAIAANGSRTKRIAIAIGITIALVLAHQLPSHPKTGPLRIARTKNFYPPSNARRKSTIRWKDLDLDGGTLSFERGVVPVVTSASVVG